MKETTDAMIQVEHVTFSYQREHDQVFVKALEDVDFQIEKGSFTAIIGRNGSGKSTLAKNINGLFLPESGRILVEELDTADSSQIWNIRQKVGMVFQNPDNQMVSAIVEDDVAFGPENLGIEPEEIRRRVDGSLKAVNMYEFRKKAPHMLSGGQKQRIAIAGVIAMLPECIVFDEPTAMLDPKGRRDVLEIIRTLNQKEKKTVVLITHFMEEAAEADRVIIMHDGHVKMDGSPREIFCRVEELKALGLAVPFAAELAYRLRQKGIEIPGDIIHMEELTEAIQSQYRRLDEKRA